LGDFRAANINMPDNWKGMAPVAAISSNVRRRG
jgi:hypothetical protein